MPSNIATAADYADAMMIARRAKNFLFLLLLIMLLAQIGIFLVARLTNHVLPGPVDTSSLADTAGTAATTLPAATQPAVGGGPSALTVNALRYATALIDFLGIVAVLVLAVVLSLITKIMLVGRLIGVAQVTSAFIRCAFLALLLFPWQAFLQNTDFTGDFKLPGVLYTWPELVHPTTGAKFAAAGFDAFTILRWARFVGFPVLAVILLLVIQAKSSRGLRAALGESELEDPTDIHVS
jgi:hypothetical protein